MDILDSCVVGLVYDLGLASEVMAAILELRLLLPNQSSEIWRVVERDEGVCLAAYD